MSDPTPEPNLRRHRSPGAFIATQMSRLNEALGVSSGAMAAANLPAVDRGRQNRARTRSLSGLGRRRARNRSAPQAPGKPQFRSRQGTPRPPGPRSPRPGAGSCRTGAERGVGGYPPRSGRVSRRVSFATALSGERAEPEAPQPVGKLRAAPPARSIDVSRLVPYHAALIGVTPRALPHVILLMCSFARGRYTGAAPKNASGWRRLDGGARGSWLAGLGSRGRPVGPGAGFGAVAGLNGAPMMGRSVRCARPSSAPVHTTRSLGSSPSAQNSIEVFADRARNLGAFDPFRREMHLGLGAAIENLVLAARAHGVMADVEPTKGRLAISPPDTPARRRRGVLQTHAGDATRSSPPSRTP